MSTDSRVVQAAPTPLRAGDAMLETVFDAAARLLAARADALDTEIGSALQRVGEQLGADRGYLLQFSSDGARLSQSHGWCVQGITPPKLELPGLPAEGLARWWASMLGSDIVSVPDVAAMSAREAAQQARLECLGIRALFAIPLRQAGRSMGFIGFDRVRTAQGWDVPTPELLSLLANLIGGALLRRAGEQALQQQHRFTQAVLDSVPANVAVLDREGVIVAVNEPWRRFAAGNASRAGEAVRNTDVGTHYLDVCRRAETADGACADGALAGIQAVMAGREPSFRHEYPCHSPDRHRWFQMTVLPFSGGGEGVVISHADITERRLAEEAAEAATERLRRGQAFANVGTWDWNIVSGEVHWTERVAPLFGHPEGELKTSYDDFLAAVHPDDRQAVAHAVRACFDHDVPYQIEHRVVWPDGTVRWLLERGAVQRDAQGQPLRMLGVVQDVDDRKQAELALAERERQLLEAQRLASVGHWTANLVTGELVWSDEIYRIFGHEPGSFAPSVQAFHAAVHPDDLALVQDSEGQAGKTGRHDVVHRIVRPDGSIRHVRELAQMQLDGQGRPLRLTGTVQDVTERVAFEQALVAAREAADRANRAKSEFLSSMSHELRTPMNAILGFSQLMEIDNDLSDLHRDYVKEILRGGRHLLELIDEVLDLARIESGRIELTLEPVELGPVVEQCLSLVRALAAERQIRISHQGFQGVAVRADRTRLKQVLLNLLSNAIKYNRDGGSVRLSVEPEGSSRLRIRVTDTGRGIPAGRQAELFQPFRRLGAERSGIEGTGIGLAIARRIVEMMDGSVGVHSEVGVGSSFWIELPLLAQAAGYASSKAPPPALPAGGTATMAGLRTVLCVEDNPANLRLLTQFLGHVPDIHLLTAHTPALGIELARANRPDLILLDINLPGMDGYRLLGLIKAEAELKDTPVVAITANAMPPEVERGLAAGFADYLTKPLDLEQFLVSVKRHLSVRDGRAGP